MCCNIAHTESYVQYPEFTRKILEEGSNDFNDPRPRNANLQKARVYINIVTDNTIYNLRVYH